MLGFLFKHSIDKPLVAKSGTFGSNCGLHGIIHTWLDLSYDKIIMLYQTFPVFERILILFGYAYGLTNIDDLKDFLEDFLVIMENIAHPVDREKLLGPIFRCVLIDLCEQNKISSDDIVSLKKGNFIPDDLLAILVKAMGGELIVRNMQFQHIQNEIKYIPKDFIPQWQVQLFHSSNHFNFKYDDLAKDLRHNQARKTPNVIKGGDPLRYIEKQQFWLRAKVRY